MTNKRMKRKAVFIVGTDTGVGKTFVATALAQGLADRGHAVRVMKPYAAGSWADTRALKSAARSPQSLRDITPAFVKLAAAPAAALLNRPRVTRALFWDVVERLKRFSSADENLIIEGIGGVLVPLGAGRTALDLVKAAGAPVWVVARPGLGTLNHTLLTCDILKRHKVTIERIILSGYTGRGTVQKTNPLILRDVLGRPVHCLARAAGPNGRRKIQAELARIFLEESRHRPSRR
jgi:dethiobiotin synthetase